MCVVQCTIRFHIDFLICAYVFLLTFGGTPVPMILVGVYPPQTEHIESIVRIYVRAFRFSQ